METCSAKRAGSNRPLTFQNMKENSIKYRDALFVYIYRIINAQTVLLKSCNKYTCYIWVFFRKFRVVSVFFGLFRFVTKQFCLFRLFRYRFETPKQTEIICFGFTKQTETQPKQILFRFVSVRTKILFVCFEDTLLPALHPAVSWSYQLLCSIKYESPVLL